ncbi:transposase family protein, partial [Salmonella sp. gx-f5]|nr:transposase family protein [Salmonella sp. gx-f5]
SETRKTIEAFYNLVETQFELKIKILRSDNGSEFLMTEFFNNKGIIHQTTCIATPQQKGIVERKHQHLLNVARAFKLQSGLPLEYWNDCV